MKKQFIALGFVAGIVIIYGAWFGVVQKNNTQIHNKNTEQEAGQGFLLEESQISESESEKDYSDEEKFIAEHPKSEFMKIAALAYIERGLQNSARSAWRRAENLLTRFTAENPDDFEAFEQFINAKSLLVKPEEGIKLAERKLKNFPQKRAEIIFILGKLHDQVGNRERAQYYLEQAVIKLPPEDFRIFHAYFLLARLELQEDMHPDENAMRKIQEYASKLIDVNRANLEQAIGHAILAEMYHHGQDNQQKAILEAKKALALYPQCYACEHVLAEVFIKHENHQDIGLLDKAINILHKNPQRQRLTSQNYYLLGMAYWHKGERELARKFWRAGLSIIPIDPFHPAWFKKTIKKQLEDALALE